MGSSLTPEMEAQFAALKKALSYSSESAGPSQVTAYGPVRYEPGDATSYIMHLVHCPVAGILGYTGGCYVLSVLNMPGHVWTLGEWVGPYDLEIRGIKVNPWTIRACLKWLKSLGLDDLNVEMNEEYEVK